MNWKHLLVACLCPGIVCALPKGAQIVSGHAEFSQTDPQSLHIHVGDRAIVNYDSFNIDTHEKVVFIQPGKSSSVLNRVKGGDPSCILGSLQSNGKVFLVNPQGMYFGPEARVNVGSLIASALDIHDRDFLNEKYTFFLTPGSETSQITNRGTLCAIGEGVVALLAPDIRNDGIIQAAQGKVLLGSAEKMTLDFANDGLLHFTTDSPIQDGSHLGVHVHTAQQVIQAVINTEGVLEGEVLVKHNGKIKILSQSSIRAHEIALIGEEESHVVIEGGLDASSLEGKGGSIKIAAEHVSLKQGSLDANGYRGGGDIWIHAESIEMDPVSTIYADAIDVGDGGRVTVWGEGQTVFNGQIFARGGALSGDGGWVETSGQSVLKSDLGRVNTLAPRGSIGTWLLDPATIVIDAAGAGTLVQAANCGSGGGLTISPATINGALSNVVLCASSSITQNAGQNVNITASGVGITLTAPTTTLNGSITTNNGAITFNGSNAVVLGGTTALTSGGGIVSFDSTINGAQSLTVNSTAGNVVFSGAIGGTTPLLDVEVVGGAISFFGDVSARNCEIVNSSLFTLGPNVDVALTGLFVQNGAGNSLLQGNNTITASFAGTGEISFYQGLGIAGDVSLQSDRLILLLGAVTGDIAGRQVTLNGGVGNVHMHTMGTSAIPLGDVNITAAVEISQLGDMYVDTIDVHTPAAFRSSGDITVYNGPLSVNAPVFLESSVTYSTALAGGDIAFPNTINGDGAGLRNLTLVAGGGDISFTGSVGGVVPLGHVLIGSAGHVTSNAMTVASMTQLAGTGTTRNNGTWTTTGDVVIKTDTITFNAPISAANMTIEGYTSINNVTTPVVLTTTGVASFNALRGRVGTADSPIAINTTQAIYAGAHHVEGSLLIDVHFLGTPFHDYQTPSPAVFDIVTNPPCSIAFNGVIIKQCVEGSIDHRHLRPSDLPARYLYEPWVYAMDTSLGSDFWFVRDWIDFRYMRVYAPIFWAFPHVNLKQPKERSERGRIEFWKKYTLWPFKPLR